MASGSRLRQTDPGPRSLVGAGGCWTSGAGPGPRTRLNGDVRAVGNRTVRAHLLGSFEADQERLWQGQIQQPWGSSKERLWTGPSLMDGTQRPMTMVFLAHGGAELSEPTPSPATSNRVAYPPRPPLILLLLDFGLLLSV